MSQPHGDAAAFPGVVNIEILAAARAVGVGANRGPALFDRGNRFAQGRRRFAGRQHGARLPAAGVGLGVAAHGSAEFMGLLLDPVADVDTAARYHQDQEHEKCQHADKNFHARAAALASGSSGRRRHHRPHRCSRCSWLGGTALGTESGSIGQRVSTTYTECCHEFLPSKIPPRPVAEPSGRNS